MKTLDFFEWRDIRAKDLDPGERIECPDCYGAGEAECDHCGHYSDCETCESKGKVYAGDVSEKQIRDSLTHKQYEDALKHDLIDLANWTGADIKETFVNHGLVVYCHIDSKMEFAECL